MIFVRLVRYVLRFVLLLIGSIEHSGSENLPASDGYILTPNHLSIVDAPAIFLALPMPPMTLHYFAGEKWARHPIYGPLLKRIHAVFINRGEVDRKALRQAMTILKSGGVFGVAPEGTRSRTGGLIRAKDGAAYLASRADVQLVPCAMVDSDQVGKNILRLRRTKIKIRFGKPYRLPKLERPPRGSELAACSHLIMVRIADILPERYHGYYAASPALAALKRGEDPFPFCLQAESKTHAN